MGFKEKALNGIGWNFFSKFSNYFIEFIVSIILARLLGPEEFGIIASLNILILLFDVFVNSGFYQALIREKEVSEDLYSTIFWFNLLIAILCFGLLIITGDIIGDFLYIKGFSSYINVLGIVLILNACSLVQRIKVIRAVDFKKQSVFLFVASIVSSIVAIFMAIEGFGVWALIIRIVVLKLIELSLYMYNSRWVPRIVFLKDKFLDLLNFSYKLLISSLLEVGVRNFNYFVIGRNFSPNVLGFYTRADMFRNIISQNVAMIVSQVSYPMLSNIKDSEERMRGVYFKFLFLTIYISGSFLTLLCASADNVIVFLLGNGWQPSIVYLQLLCLSGFFIPISFLSNNVFNIVGRSDIYLKVQGFSYILLIPTIFLSIKFGMIFLLVSNIFVTVNVTFISIYFSCRCIKAPFWNVIVNILTRFLFFLVIGFLVYLVKDVYSNIMINILIQSFVCLTLLVLFSILTKNKEFLYIKNLFFKKVNDVL